MLLFNYLNLFKIGLVSGTNIKKPMNVTNMNIKFFFFFLILPDNCQYKDEWNAFWLCMQKGNLAKKRINENMRYCVGVLDSLKSQGCADLFPHRTMQNILEKVQIVQIIFCKN